MDQRQWQRLRVPTNARHPIVLLAIYRFSGNVFGVRRSTTKHRTSTRNTNVPCDACRNHFFREQIVKHAKQCLIAKLAAARGGLGQRRDLRTRKAWATRDSTHSDYVPRRCSWTARDVASPWCARWHTTCTAGTGRSMWWTNRLQERNSVLYAWTTISLNDDLRYTPTTWNQIKFDPLELDCSEWWLSVTKRKVLSLTC